MNRHFCPKCGKANFYETNIPNMCGFCANSFAGTPFKAQAASIVLADNPSNVTIVNNTPLSQQPQRRFGQHIVDDGQECEGLDYSGLNELDVIIGENRRDAGITVGEIGNMNPEVGVFRRPPEPGEFGYENNKPIIKVSIHSSNEDWLETLIHEYCHAQQAFDGDPTWKRFENNPEIWDAFSHNCDQIKRQNFIKIVIALEIDCERRAINMIKKYGLPVDIDKYIQVANLTLYKWVFLAKYGVWPKLNKAEQEELSRQCRTTLNKPINFMQMPSHLESKFLESYTRLLLS